MVYCCVPYCKSALIKKGKNVISFHQFPSDLNLQVKWLQAIGRENFVVNSKSPSSVVCGKHFRPEDYVKGITLKKLVKNAVPSVFKDKPVIAKDKRKRKLSNKRPSPEENASDSSEEKLPKAKRSNVHPVKTEVSSGSDLEASVSESIKSSLQFQKIKPCKIICIGPVILNKGRKEVRL